MSTYVRNGRGSAHSNIAFSAWQRHTPQCDARGNVTKRTGKRCNKCRAYDATQEVRFYALATALVMTGEQMRDANGKPVKLSEALDLTDAKGYMFLCPLSRQWVPIIDAQADRIVTGEDGGRYVPANICLVSVQANLAREVYAHNVKRYARDVRAASAKVQRAMGIPLGVDMPSGWRVLAKGRQTPPVDVPNVLAGGPYAA